MRSLATRRAHLALSARPWPTACAVLQGAGFDLILVETAGIGQSDSEIVDLVDLSLYVMTPEFGAPSQLEKIDMLDLADVVILNKFDQRGGEDALRDVERQWRRNRGIPHSSEELLPIFPTIASRWNDPGTDRAYQAPDRTPRRERLRRLPSARRPRAPAARAGASRTRRAHDVPLGDRRGGARVPQRR